MRKRSGVFAKLMSRFCRSKKYIGKYVAVVKNQAIAIGRNHLEAFENARKVYPKGPLGIYYIPTAEEAVTALCNIRISK